MLLSYTEICELIERGVIRNTTFNNVNGSSLDLTLGDYVIRENSKAMLHPNGYPIVDMTDARTSPMTEKVFIGNEPYLLAPQEFVLSHTVEEFHLTADISAEYKLKSTIARNGLNHLTAGWADPHWNNSVLTLEFVNHLQFHTIQLKAGMKCGQMIFFKHAPVPYEKGYAVRGSYNADRSVSPGKGLK